MTALDLVEYLIKNCNDLSIENDNIVIDCEEGVLTDEIICGIRESKSELMLILQEIESVQAEKVTTSIHRTIGEYEASLTSAQKSLLYSDRINDNACVYNVVVSYRLEGSADFSRMEKALKQLVFLHDVLRTTYVISGNEVRQCVGTDIKTFISVNDYSCSIDPKADVDSCIRCEQSRPFNLQKEWPFRAAFCKVNDFESYIVLNLHHAIVDGRSARIICDDISRLYNDDKIIEDLRKNRLLHYYDYVSWRENNYQSDAFDNAQAYWVNALEGAPHIHSIPTDRRREGFQRVLGLKYKAASRSVSSHDISTFASKNVVSSTSIYQAVFAALIARYSNSSDIVFGSVVSNRYPIGFNNVVGLFSNMLAIRLKLESGMTLKELLEEANQLNSKSLNYQFYPFDELVTQLNPSRIPHANPLIQIALLVHDGGNDVLSLNGLDVTSYPVKESYSKFDIALHIKHIDNKISLEWDYNPDLFDDCTIGNMSQAYDVLLQNMMHDSDIELNQIELVGRKVKRGREHGTKKPDQKVNSIYNIFHDHVRAEPQAIAVISDHKELTYEELLNLVDYISDELYLLYGPLSNSAVGVLLNRSIEWVASILAISKMGGVYVPIDPFYPKNRIDYILEDADIRVLIKDKSHELVLEKQNLFTYCIDKGARKTSLESGVVAVEPSGSEPAYIIYTSGSTGRPKGVVVTVSNLFYSLYANSKIFEANCKDIMPTIGSQSFGASILETLIPVFNGSSIQILDKNDTIDMKKLYNSTVRVSILHAVPSLMFRWLDYLDDNNLASNYLNLRLVLVGAEPVSQELLRRIKATFPSVRVVELYGMTESTVVCSSYEYSESNDFPFYCIGRPNGFTDFYVLNDSLKLQPPGSVGTLYIGGKTIASGYINSQELTDRKFIESPFDEHKILFNTGDLVRETNSGEYQFVGRSDHQIKIRGIRVELGEIEAVVNEVKGVERSIVVASKTSNNEDLLTLYYLCKKVKSSIHNEIYKQISTNLPVYMHPHKVISTTEFPVNSNGKIDREKLQFIECKDATSSSISETEQELIDIFKRLLGVDVVNVADSFFEHGGNSLLLSRLSHEIKKSWGVEIEISDMYASPSIASLGKQIDCLIHSDQQDSDLLQAYDGDEITL